MIINHKQCPESVEGQELVVKGAFRCIFGDTTDPGVEIFRRLKKDWSSLTINYSSLEILDLPALPDWVKAEAEAVHEWCQEALKKHTFPRGDYLELLKLTYVFLGGELPGFQISILGPDSHARWMGKCIGALKIGLLGSQWQGLGEEDRKKMRDFAIFVSVIYVRHWFETPLATCAARLDLRLYGNILRYRKINGTLAFKVRN